MLSKFSSEKGFCAEMIDYTNWIVCLFKDTEESDEVKCLLKRKSGGPEIITIAFKVTALSPDGCDLLLSDVATRPFEKEGRYESENLLEISGPLSNFLWNDTLILKCCLKKSISEDLVSKTCFARSRTEKEKKDFLWTVRSFESGKDCENISITLESSIHGIRALNAEILRKRTEEFLAIRIKTDNSLSKPATVRCKISLLGTKGKTIASEEDEYTFGNHSRFDTWIFPEFIKMSMLGDFVFHLKFKLNVSSKSGETVTVRNFYKFSLDQEPNSAASEATLNCDLHRLYSERKFCDVTLMAGDKEFRAHKNILSIRSPVFDSMFQNDMLEKNTGVVNITDVDAEVLNMLLEYVYSDKISNDLSMGTTMKLYLVADKYQILSLKNKCSALLKFSLTSSNVFRVLAFADDYQDSQLKTAVKDFICIFGYEILDSDFWRNFMAERAHLAAEIMHQVTINCLKAL